MNELKSELKFKPRRVNVELGPKSYAHLEKLKDETEASSKVEVIRIALQVLAKIVEEVQSGGRILVERDTGEKIEIYLPGPPGGDF